MRIESPIGIAIFGLVFVLLGSLIVRFSDVIARYLTGEKTQWRKVHIYPLGLGWLLFGLFAIYKAVVAWLR